jgi:hypothetical protein
MKLLPLLLGITAAAVLAGSAALGVALAADNGHPTPARGTSMGVRMDAMHRDPMPDPRMEAMRRDMTRDPSLRALHRAMTRDPAMRAMHRAMTHDPAMRAMHEAMMASRPGTPPMSMMTPGG